MRRIVVLAAAHTAQLLNKNENDNGNSSTTTSSSRAEGREPQSPKDYAGRGGRYENDMRNGNVNVLLGGAMMGMIIVVIILLCYCCHRNMRKSRPHEYSPYWRGEPDVHSLEVFTMDSHIAQCYDRNTLQALGQLGHLTIPEEPPARPVTPGPPPAYESLIFSPVVVLASSPSDKKPDYEIGHNQPLNSGPVSCILPVPVDLDRGQESRRNSSQHQSIVDELRADDEGLPSYEAALKLEAHGYV